MIDHFYRTVIRRGTPCAGARPEPVRDTGQQPQPPIAQVRRVSWILSAITIHV
jgi:hypothetical protein